MAVVLRLPDSWSNWNLENVCIRREEKSGTPQEKPLGAKKRTNNKHVTEDGI